jgi:hypothetical protein
LIVTVIVIAFPGEWAGANIEKAQESSGRRLPQISARLDRIAVLLAELDNLPLLFAEAPAVLTQARETLRSIEDELATRSLAYSAPTAAGGDDDFQPHVDREVLERHFRALHR